MEDEDIAPQMERQPEGKQQFLTGQKESYNKGKEILTLQIEVAEDQEE